MTPAIDEALIEEVTLRILEEAAFLFAERAEAPIDPTDTLAVTLPFSGSTVGRCELLAERALATQLAANMLGEEENDPDAEDNAPAALAELLNILVGAILSELYGRKVVSHLGIPEQTKPSPAPAGAVVLPLVTDEHQSLELRLVVEA